MCHNGDGPADTPATGSGINLMRRREVPLQTVTGPAPYGATHDFRRKATMTMTW